MRTTHSLLICFLTVFAAGLLPAPAAGQVARPKVAVLLLLHDSAVSDTQATQVREAVRSTLASRGQAAKPSAEVDRLLGSTDISCTTGDCMGRTAGTLGVDRLVGGRLERAAGASGGNWTLALWLYDARKKETAAVHTARCEGCSTVLLVGTAIQASRVLLAQVDQNRGSRIAVRSRPRGALVTIDDVPRGVTDLAFGVTPGKHTVVLTLDGYEATTHTVEVKPGAEAVVDVHLAPATAGPADKGGGALSPRVFKWVALGAAVATLGAGIALMVMDGQETCDKAHDHYVCPERYETLTPGVALVATGAALGGAAGLLFYLDGKKGGGAAEEPRKTMAISPTVTRGGGGVTAVLTF